MPDFMTQQVGRRRCRATVGAFPELPDIRGLTTRRQATPTFRAATCVDNIELNVRKRQNHPRRLLCSPSLPDSCLLIFRIDTHVPEDSTHFWFNVRSDFRKETCRVRERHQRDGDPKTGHTSRLARCGKRHGGNAFDSHCAGHGWLYGVNLKRETQLGFRFHTKRDRPSRNDHPTQRTPFDAIGRHIPSGPVASFSRELEGPLLL